METTIKLFLPALVAVNTDHLLVWVMTILTAAIVVLTVFVVCYASRTLDVARRSLDFFVKPRAAFKEQQKRKLHRHYGSSASIATATEYLINESAQHIQVNSVSHRIVCDKSSPAARQLNLGLRFVVDGNERVNLPLFPQRSVMVILDFSPTGPDPLPPGAIQLTVSIDVQCAYRGRGFPIHKEFEYEV